MTMKSVGLLFFHTTSQRHLLKFLIFLEKAIAQCTYLRIIDSNPDLPSLLYFSSLNALYSLVDNSKRIKRCLLGDLNVVKHSF